MKVSPCKDCTKRFVTCHASCQDYKDWCEENQKLKESVAQELRNKQAINDHRAWVHERIRRQRG